MRTSFVEERAATVQSTTDAVASHETQCKSVRAGDPGPNPAQATPRRELNLERPGLSAYFLCAFRQARRLAAMTWLVTYQAILAFQFRFKIAEVGDLGLCEECLVFHGFQGLLASRISSHCHVIQSSSLATPCPNATRFVG